MDFSLQYLSFFVIQNADNDQKTYKHFQTLDRAHYENSEIKHFLEEEFERTVKRKVDRNPNSENAPVKIGRFVTEPGHELSSNPNFNLFQQLRDANTKEEFQSISDELVRGYMNTAAVRGGALIVANGNLSSVSDDPFIFVLKCDFESKIARISDEKSLISRVEMAISARNIKSIMYPFMPEEGMIEEAELKIYQSTHSRYFEDFLKYVSYEKPMPEIVNEQVITLVHEYMEDKWSDNDSEERQQEEQVYELWASKDKRHLQEKWDEEQVVHATRQIIEHNPEVELKFKLDGTQVKGSMSDFGSNIHIARMNNRYVVLLEGDSFEFDRNVTPIELLKPNSLQELIKKLSLKSTDEDTPPWD